MNLFIDLIDLFFFGSSLYSFFLSFLSVSLSFFVCSCLINIVLWFNLGVCLPVNFFQGWFSFFSLSLSLFYNSVPCDLWRFGAQQGVGPEPPK